MSAKIAAQLITQRRFLPQHGLKVACYWRPRKVPNTYLSNTENAEGPIMHQTDLDLSVLVVPFLIGTEVGQVETFPNVFSCRGGGRGLDKPALR